MGRYVVLLRGINVGRNKRIAMADLRALLTDLGFTAVRTLLNSGNAVVTGPDGEHSPRIEAAIHERLGLDVRCVVLTADELRTIVDGHPLVDVATDGSRMMAHVLSATPDVVLDVEGAVLGARVIYQWCPDGVLAAPPIPDKQLGVVVTARNWNTITKLADLL